MLDADKEMDMSRYKVQRLEVVSLQFHEKYMHTNDNVLPPILTLAAAHFDHEMSCKCVGVVKVFAVHGSASFLLCCKIHSSTR